MKAISLWRPWAGYVVLNWKTIETRLHRRFDSLLGQTIAIHASLKYDKDAFVAAASYMDDRQIDAHLSANAFERYVLQRTGLVGTVYVSQTGKLIVEDSQEALIDCGVTTRYGLFLEDAKLFKTAMPFKGKQGIFSVPDELIARLGAGEQEQVR